RSDTLCPQVWRAMWNRGKCCKSALFHPQFPPVVVLWTRCYARRSRDPERSGTSGVERSIELTAETLWNAVAGRLKGALNETTYRTWFAEAKGNELTYNPLFIYGGTGLGKTHLMQASAQYVGEHSGDLSVRYVTSETFMNDFINSLRDKRIEGFKQRYRTYDLLLVDDVQFFEHKERIQEEFFHTFNSLYEAGSQIVMSSDRPPRDIATLEARLRSRFEWGLITDIQPPDLETRIAILRKKVKTDGIHVPETEVLTFIASRVSTNIREL